MKWFILEGSIGSGKSSILRALASDTVETVQEPVDVWQHLKGEDDKSLLDMFYDDPKRYAYLFQTIVFKTRLQSLDAPQLKPVRVSERSVWTDRYVFMEGMKNSHLVCRLEEACYDAWYDWLTDKFQRKPDGIIYVRCAPEVCFSRIMKRAREAEKHMPLMYLEELHRRHEDWLGKWDTTPVHVVDNSLDDNLDEVVKTIQNIISPP